MNIHKLIRINIILLICGSFVFGQSLNNITFGDHLNLSEYQMALNKHTFGSPLSLPASGVEYLESDVAETSLLQELGYISAQQLVFVGLSHLSRKESGAGPLIVSGLDLFFSGAGLMNIAPQKTTLKKIGYLTISTGFMAKSYYTLKAGSNHSEKQRFWINYLSYNVLVYTGYLLDEL